MNVRPLIYPTYLAMIENSVGTNMFRTLVAEVDGAVQDITRNGEISCAFFASSLIHNIQLIKKPHATVEGTVKDLLASGWQDINAPEPGTVLVWEAVDFGDGDMHKHIGFYTGDEQAVSNSMQMGSPVKHNWTFGGERKVLLMLSHPAFEA
jgi:hypothetical protein